MQIMLINNKFLFRLSLIFAIILQSTATGASERPLAFQLEKEIVCIWGVENRIVGQCDIVIQSKLLNKNIRNVLQRSSKVLPIFSQPFDAGHYLVLVARIPSKSPQSTGYCGAGYEDHLLLLTYEKNKIKLFDDFLLQSCLNSISLYSDGDDDILNSLSINMDKYLIGFRWLDNTERERTLSISHGKFLLK